MTPILLGVFVAAAAISWLLTGLVREHSLRRGMLDIPNHRSSHTLPTPRGGGLSIAGTLLAVVVGLAASGHISLGLATALVGGGSLVAVIGWIDDWGGVSAKTRAVVHFIAAIWSVAWIGGLDALGFGDAVLRLGILGSVIAVLLTVWSINLFNFMDGIDGIAGSEATSVALASAFVFTMLGEPGLAAFVVGLAGATLGFLRWNWPPAKIFMGDVGSGLLGFVIATIGLAAERSRPGTGISIVLVFGVFVVDATITLLRRALRGERWYLAHRSHAYQRAAVRYGHRFVTIGVLLLNSLLAFLAVRVVQRPADTLWASLVALSVLLVTYLVVESIAPMSPAVDAIAVRSRAELAEAPERSVASPSGEG